MAALRSVSVGELRAAMAEGATVIDVREPVEFAGGHVPGARLVPLMTVPAAVEDLRSEPLVYVICEVGARSARAALFLEHNGVPAVNVDGGMSEWVAAGYPVEL